MDFIIFYLFSLELSRSYDLGRGFDILTQVDSDLKRKLILFSISSFNIELTMTWVS
jgi:hypothetical protein